MSKHTPVFRGAVAVRADATDPKALAAQINAALADFKETHTQEVKELKAGQADFVTTDKMDKLQSAITDMTTAHDKLAQDLAAAQMGGGDDNGMSAEDVQYGKDFNAWFRKGKNEDAIEAAIAAGKISAATSVGSDPDGGYTAPVEWDRTITDKRVEISEMRMYASSQSVSGQGFTKLYNLRGTGSGWVGETAARPETGTSTLAPYSFGFGEIYANAAATQRILDDSEIDMGAWMASEVNTEFALQEGTAFMSGDGSNKPKGFLNYTAVAEAALAANLRHPLGHIKEVVSGAAAALTADGLVDIAYDLPANRSQGAAWYMNRKTMATVRKMKDGDGNFLWERNYDKGQPGAILGYAVRELSGMPDVAADAIPVAFGVMSETYRIFDRKGTTVLRDPYTNKPYVMFYTTQRVGGGLWNPEFMRYHTVSA